MFLSKHFFLQLFPRKYLVFYSSFSSHSLWGIPRVDSKGKDFEIQISRFPEYAYPALFLTAEA